MSSADHGSFAVVLGDSRTRGTNLRPARSRATLMAEMPLRFTIELDREADGRWIAEVTDLPGVMAYGKTRELALAAVEALALRVVADRLEHGEATPEQLSVSFAVQ